MCLQEERTFYLMHWVYQSILDFNITNTTSWFQSIQVNRVIIQIDPNSVMVMAGILSLMWALIK